MEGLAPLLTRAGLQACLRAGAAAPRAGGPLLVSGPGRRCPVAPRLRAGRARRPPGEGLTRGNPKPCPALPAQAQHPVLLATLVLGLLLRHHGAQAYRGRGQAPGRQAPNPYTVLGLDQGERSEARIKFAYRNLVKQYHPDKAKDKSEKTVQRFHEVQEAYETLTDPKKLHQWHASQRGGGGRRGYTVHHHHAGNPEATYNRHTDRANFHWNAGATIHSQYATDLNAPLFMKTVFSNQAWVVQIFDDASARCREEAGLFEQAAMRNAEVAKFGRVRFSWFHHLARKMVAHVGLARTLRLEHLPLVLVYSPACRSFNCGRLVRGRMTKAKIEDLLARTLRLPELPELTRETLYAFVEAAPREKTVVVALLGDKGVSSAVWRHFALQHKHLVLATMRYKAQDTKFWRREAQRMESVLRGRGRLPTVGDLLVFSDRRPLIQQIIRKDGMEKSALEGIKGPLVPPLSPRTRKHFKDCEEPAACLFATGAHVGGLLDLFYDLKWGTKFPEASASWPRRVKKLFDSNTLVAGWIDHKRQRAFLEQLNVTVPRANETALIYFQRKVYRKAGRKVKNADPYIGEDIILHEFRDPQQHADASSLGMEDLVMWVDRVADYGTFRPSHRPMNALRPPPEPLADWGGWARFCGMYYDVFGMLLGPLVAEHYPVSTEFAYGGRGGVGLAATDMCGLCRS